MAMSGTGSNPLVAQGTLNRIRGSVVIPAYPALNVTAPFLGKEGIRLTLVGKSTIYIPTMTGAVTSGEPYQMAAVEIHLLKTQSLANAYETQKQLLATIGTFNVIPDTSVLTTYTIVNGAISELRQLNFDGTDAGYVVTLEGYYLINNSLFSLT